MKFIEQLQVWFSVVIVVNGFMIVQILMEVERLSTNKLNKLNEIEKLEKYIDDAPLIHENIIINKINTYKRAIADKSNDSLRQVLRILFKRILVSPDSIDLVINLNAFLNTESQKNLEMIISESRENIEKLDKKFKINISWSSIKIK